MTGKRNKTALERLQDFKKQAELRQERRDKERVSCPECDTEIWKDEINEAIVTAENHDEKRHGGEPTTKVNGIVPPNFTDEQKEGIQTALEHLEGQE